MATKNAKRVSGRICGRGGGVTSRIARKNLVRRYRRFTQMSPEGAPLFCLGRQNELSRETNLIYRSAPLFFPMLGFCAPKGRAVEAQGGALGRFEIDMASPERAR